MFIIGENTTADPLMGFVELLAAALTYPVFNTESLELWEGEGSVG
jgi:hypothetical protein